MAKPRFLHSGNESGGLFAAISLRLVGRALRLRLRGITDGLSQHLAKLGLGLWRLARWFLPCCHEPHLGMRPVELNPRSELLLTVHVRFRALNGLNSDIAPFPKNVSARCPAQGLAASSDIRAISLEAPIT